MKYNNLKDFFKNKTNIIGLLISFIGAFILFPNYFNLNIQPLSLSKELWMSLDPSWVIALNYIKLNQMTWGLDVAFTYGPFAQLLIRASWGESKYVFLFFDIFIFINYFLIFFISFKRSSTKLITTLIFISVFLLSPIWVGSANALILMAFLVFWIRLSIEKTYWLYYFFQTLIIVILFYAKFNTGLIALPLFYSGLVYNFYINKNFRKSIIIISILPIVLIILLSFPLNVNLLGYIVSGFEIVKGYNDIMYLENQLENSTTIAFYLLLVITLTIVYNLYFNYKKEWLKITSILFLFGTSFFVLYKQAFVRADISHIKDFFIFFPLIVLCNPDIYIKIKNKALKVILTFTIIYSVYFVLIKLEGKTDLKIKFNKTDYISSFFNYSTTSGLNIYQNNSPLPDDIIKKIGNNTIDVFPWNIQLLLENKLNYLPRPVIQSYSAYTPYLEELNFKHYNSINAPEFVLYDYASIDERYPLYDESKVNLVLLKNYTIESSFVYDKRNILLLKKKKDFKKVTFTKTKEYAMFINSSIVMEEGKYYEVYLYHSLKGKLNSTTEHAPEVTLEIISNNGQPIKYKTSKLLLESGLFSTYSINQTSEFMNLIQNPDLNNKMKGFYVQPLDLSLFKDKIKIIEYKIN